MQKEVEELACSTKIIPTKTRSGGIGQTHVKEKAPEPTLKKKRLRKIIFPVEEEEVEDEEVHLKRKARQHVDTLMSSAIIASARLLAVSSIENVGEVTQHADNMLRD